MAEFNVKSNNLVPVLLAVVVLWMAAGAAAQAQATRTWVSGVGDDANPCSRTAPCKTFAGAISKTAVSGEINVLDPGGFGAVTITKAISIISQFEAGVLVSGTNGIVISAGTSDKVLLEGLDFEGLGTGLDGIKVLQVGLLTVRKCAIRNFTQNGIEFVPTTNSLGLVEDSQIIGNAAGIKLAATGGATGVFIERTVVSGNTSFGLQVNTNNAALLNSATITNFNGSYNAITGTGLVLTTGTNLIDGVTPTLTPFPLK